MALGKNMRRKTLIPVNEEELSRHEESEAETKESPLSPAETPPQQKPTVSGATSVTNQTPAGLNEQQEANEEVKIIFKPSLRTKVNKINVNISGKLTIYNLPFINAKMQERCNTFATVDVTLKEVQELDLSFIQFVHYYIQEKKQANHTVVFDLEQPAVNILKLISLCNYGDLLIKKKLT